MTRRQFLVSTAAGLAGTTAMEAAVARQGEPAWQSLFDGKGLGAWKPTVFGGDGDVHIEDGTIVLEPGQDLTGITWSGTVPKAPYEIALDARRLSGGDFFCGLTFPIRDTHCSFIVGGWAGAVVGLSTLDGVDASENDTTKVRDFEDKRWYAIRLQVEDERIRAWIDNESFVDVRTAGRRIGIRPEVNLSRPLGIASWRTRAAVRAIRTRSVSSTA